jgi:hypothetical protein
MLAFLASKRLLLSGELSFGGVAPRLAAGLAFSAATFGAGLGGRPPLATGFAFPAAAFGAALWGRPPLAAGLAFPAAAFGAVLWGMKTESGSERPFLMWARGGVRLRSVSDRGVSVCSKRFACARQIFLVFRRRFSVFHNRF